MLNTLQNKFGFITWCCFMMCLAIVLVFYLTLKELGQGIYLRLSLSLSGDGSYESIARSCGPSGDFVQARMEPPVTTWRQNRNTEFTCLFQYTEPDIQRLISLFIFTCPMKTYIVACQPGPISVVNIFLFKEYGIQVYTGALCCFFTFVHIQQLASCNFFQIKHTIYFVQPRVIFHCYPSDQCQSFNQAPVWALCCLSIPN